jgi:transglutaminase-like putative cysteine protease
VGIRQDLISQSNVPVFVAEIAGEVNPEDLYWRLLTLDSYSGGQWYLDRDVDVRLPEELDGYEDPDHAFRGPSVPITQEVTILALSQDWIPAVYAPREMEATNRAVDRGFRVKADDGSLRFDALSYRGMNYTVRSEVPAPDLDVLARLPDGNLSRVFEDAVADGAVDLTPSWPSGGRDGEAPPEELELRETERFTLLPDDEDLAAVERLADEQVRGLETDYERALALEAFFRAGNFVYSTDIEPGHGAADLAAWLTDRESPNYRTGYCEQFATAMGVMARQLGIPSRVVLGFTPGTLVDGQLVVRDRNAHAWVELWMPNQGWVRFDPTPRNDDANPASINDLPFDVVPYLEIPPAEPPIINGGTNPSIPFPDEFPSTTFTLPGDPGPASTSFSIDIPGWVYALLLGGLVLFGLLPFVKWVRRRVRMRRLLHGDIAAAWQEIVDRLTDLGAGPRASDTPREFADATEAAMEPLAEVYAETLYAPEVDWVAHGQRVSVATRSLDETVGRLGTRFSKLERVASWYRLRSLTPRWWIRMRRRRS